MVAMGWSGGVFVTVWQSENKKSGPCIGAPVCDGGSDAESASLWGYLIRSRLWPMCSALAVISLSLVLGLSWC